MSVEKGGYGVFSSRAAERHGMYQYKHEDGSTRVLTACLFSKEEEKEYISRFGDCTFMGRFRSKDFVCYLEPSLWNNKRMPPEEILPTVLEEEETERSFPLRTGDGEACTKVFKK